MKAFFKFSLGSATSPNRKRWCPIALQHCAELFHPAMGSSHSDKFLTASQCLPAPKCRLEHSTSLGGVRAGHRFSCAAHLPDQRMGWESPSGTTGANLSKHGQQNHGQVRGNLSRDRAARKGMEHVKPGLKKSPACYGE